MNLILIDPEELAPDGTVTLTGRRQDHIIDILNGVVGDEVRVGVVNGPVGSGRIHGITDSGLVLKFTATGPRPARPAVDLVLALPRPIMLKKIFSQAAALGVGRILLVNANRVEKSFFGASLLKDGRFNEYLRHGLEQARDTVVPEVRIHNRFRPFVEDFLPGIIADYSACLVAHPAAAAGLAAVFAGPPQGRLLLAVGPEGGWVDFEVEKFTQQGFQPFTMGERILRVDTAVTVLLGQLALLRAGERGKVKGKRLKVKGCRGRIREKSSR